MKVAIGGIFHETNSFSAVKPNEDMFRSYTWLAGEEIIKESKNVKDFLGGIIDKAEGLCVEVVPTFEAICTPSGIIQKDCYERMKENLLEGILKSDQLDGICLALHGAGVADSYPDIEGDILKTLREKVGRNIPIAVVLDLHANITEDMISNSNILIGVKYYPHVDMYESAKKAMGLLYETIAGKINPHTIMKRFPLLIPPSSTNSSPARDIKEYCEKIENLDEVLDCTFFHGFPYADIPQACTSGVVTTDNNHQLGTDIAEKIGKLVWDNKVKFCAEILSPKEGFDIALKMSDEPIVINESSDNPGGGAPGDGTYLLREMLLRDIERSCFGYICDKEVVHIAENAGIGSTISINLGAKTDKNHGDPIFIHDAYVKCISDGTVRISSKMNRGTLLNLGTCVRLTVGNVDIIITSKPYQTMDDQFFILHGIDVTKYKIIGLKSSHHFKAFFEDISKKIISVNPPGIHTADLSKLEFKNIKRPIYPLDDLDLNY